MYKSKFSLLYMLENKMKTQKKILLNLMATHNQSDFFNAHDKYKFEFKLIKKTDINPTIK